MYPVDNKKSRRLLVYSILTTSLLFISVALLLIEHYVLHYEFLLHMAAIPLEILLGAVLVDRFLYWHNRNRKKQQLMYIKSYFFRSGMRKVFLLNFRALKKPAISIEALNKASSDKLKEIRMQLDHFQYGESAEVEPVLDAYIEFSYVYKYFMEWAITNDFEEIFHDMIDLLHFLENVRLFKQRNPGELFSEEAGKTPGLAEKMHQILKDGISKFLDYIIELKDRNPEVFSELIKDYAYFEREILKTE